MKKKIICLAIIMFMMIIIPFFAIENKEKFSVDKTYLSKIQLCQLISKEFLPEYNQETLKVLGIILQTNYSNNKKPPETMTKDDFYSKYGENAEIYYNDIEKAVNAIHKLIILYKNKTVNIPYSYVTTDNYNSNLEFFQNIANPWDFLKAEFKNQTQTGVSLNTVNELCKNGYTYTDAINYFFKDIKITTAP